jgi:hypothetical protein
LYLPRHVRVIELVRVTDALIRHELSVCAAESVTLAGAKIGERHSVVAANFRVHLVNLAGKSIRWQPFRHRLRIKERAVDFFRRSTEHTVNFYRVGHTSLASTRSDSDAIRKNRDLSVELQQADQIPRGKGADFNGLTAICVTVYRTELDVFQ